MRDLAGKVAVVTGAGSSVGRAMALRFAAERMTVVIADIDHTKLRETEGALRALGARVLAEQTDVSRADEVEALAQRTRAAFGAVQLLCNNAGIFGRVAPVWEQAPEDWQRLLGVNLFGVIHGIRAFLPAMLRQEGEAHIVNTASEAAFTSRPYTSVYNASKHAVLTLSESLAYELERAGSAIGVSVLCPGSVNTGILDAVRATDTTENEVILRRMRDGVTQGMEAAAVAEAVVHAVQDGQFYIFTHPEVKPLIRDRIDAALAGRPPVLNAGFLESP